MHDNRPPKPRVAGSNPAAPTLNRPAPDPELVARAHTQASTSGTEAGERHRAEWLALGLPLAVFERIWRALTVSVTQTMYTALQVEAAGGQRAMELFIRQHAESVEEMTRICRVMEPSS